MGRVLAQPLFLSQGVASLYGLAGTLVAANVLGVSAFAQFTILTLIQGITVGVARAATSDPALITMRRDPQARVAAAHLITGLFLTAPLTFAICCWSVQISATEAVIVTGANMLAIWHDWSRFRAVAARQPWLVLASDATRLAGVLLWSVLVVTADIDLSATQIQVGFLACAFPAAALPLISTRVRQRTTTRYRELWPLARWQLVEFMASQVHITGPLLLVSAHGNAAIVGAFRLAQSLLGPVNLLWAASASNFTATNATSGRDDAEIIQSGKRLALALSLLAVAGVSGALLVVFLFGTDLFPAVGKRQLILALACVGFWTSTGASAGIHTVVLRSLFRNRLTAATRWANVALTWAGFAMGFLVWGVPGSLALGFVVGALANPLTTNLPATRVYRQASLVS